MSGNEKVIRKVREISGKKPIRIKMSGKKKLCRKKVSLLL